MVGALEKEKGPAFLQYLKFWTMMALFFFCGKVKAHDGTEKKRAEARNTERRDSNSIVVNKTDVFQFVMSRDREHSSHSSRVLSPLGSALWWGLW